MTTKDMIRPKTTEPGSKVSAPVAYRATTPFDFLQREIDRVFDGFNGWPTAFQAQGFSPSMEVTETDTAIEITAELPGLDEKDVEISVTDDVLTIRGEKKLEKDEKKKNYRLVERSYGAFERSMMLPSGVDASKVKAKMTKGVIKVEVPKPAAAKAQQVSIAVE